MLNRLNSATDNSWSGFEYYQRTNVNCAYPDGCNRTNDVLPACQAVTRSLYRVEHKIAEKRNSKALIRNNLKRILKLINKYTLLNTDSL